MPTSLKHHPKRPTQAQIEQDIAAAEALERKLNAMTPEELNAYHAKAETTLRGCLEKVQQSFKGISPQEAAALRKALQDRLK